ncbi:MAG: NADH-quinone oxidoreductase subunit NuoE [Candidatus Aminicenantes bacterium]|nr:NADH-quinone oxidoreductase subunit NuoE [Candidatus Aminicenantes bacterium]
MNGGSKMKKILKDFSRNQKEVVPILHRVQTEYGYIPPESLPEIAEHLKISESEIYGILTFYKAFSLVPRGKNIVTVCMGTACHVRGGPQILDEMERDLEIKSGRTTADGNFTLESVNCLGCCAIGPVVVVNGKYYSHISVQKVGKLLKEYKST